MSSVITKGGCKGKNIPRAIGASLKITMPNMSYITVLQRTSSTSQMILVLKAPALLLSKLGSETLRGFRFRVRETAIAGDLGVQNLPHRAPKSTNDAYLGNCFLEAYKLKSQTLDPRPSNRSPCEPGAATKKP